MFKTILDCLAFLTILPIKTEGLLTPAEMGRFPACYPVVGLVLGLASFVLATLLGWTALPVATSAVSLVLAQIVLTRGFHLDGLADAADALLSHRSQERKLEILKDSHLGTFGVLAIVADFALKSTILVSLAVGGLFPPHVLLLYPVWGRLTASAVAAWGKPVPRPQGTPDDRPVGLGHNMVALGGLNELCLASLFGLALSLIFGLKAFLCALLALVLGYFLVKLWKYCLGGVSGDLLGASVELGELATLAFFAAMG
ncbi:MAG: adenosylcobinamide-GDP ribazoletransferase [Deltaproteobacteria bacterium]|jgi:cobalamin 5'-phosphate synthase/cobalamin synthase|nr:adenosylcobinamide-GDP ribazoletransferase [Deltaproteobacteria bacterium]